MIFPNFQTLKSDTSRTSFPPVIITNVPADCRLSLEEFFAPVLVVERATSVPHAIELANAHETGLSSAIFTADYGEALSIARKLESGAVHINGMTIHDEHGLPYGGVKASGWGRFNGKGAVESFTYTKSVTLGGGGMLPLHAL